MNYDGTRKKEIREAHHRHIEEFARGYKRNRPTIVFLPGGTGSQIDRSVKPYAEDGSLPIQRPWMKRCGGGSFRKLAGVSSGTAQIIMKVERVFLCYFLRYETRPNNDYKLSQK